MARSLAVGATNYSHQTLADIKSDLENWINSLTEAIEEIETCHQTLQAKSYWQRNVPSNYTAILSTGVKLFGTALHEIKEINNEIDSNVREDHVTRLRRIGETASDINDKFGTIWNNSDIDKNWGTEEFRLVEKTYEEGRGMAGDLIDLANVADRLKDFIGKKANIESMPKQSSKPIPQSEKETWKEIKAEYNLSKPTIGKRISFIRDDKARTIIFRDIWQAFFLLQNGFNKPAVILSGGVIEEILAQLLKCKGLLPSTDTFVKLIQVCREKKLFSNGTLNLLDSIRDFRNLVHVGKEIRESKMSKTMAKTAVSSLFHILNELK